MLDRSRIRGMTAGMPEIKPEIRKPFRERRPPKQILWGVTQRIFLSERALKWGMRAMKAGDPLDP